MVVDEPNALVPYYSLGNFIEAPALSEGIEEFGLRVAQASSVDDIGAFGTYILNAPTLNLALQRITKKVKAHSSSSHFSLEQKADGVWFCRAGVKGMPNGELHDKLYSLLLMVDVVRQAAGPEWWPTKIALQAAVEVPEGLQQEGSRFSKFSS